MACESCAQRRAKLLRLAKLAAERAKALFEKAKGPTAELPDAEPRNVYDGTKGNGYQPDPLPPGHPPAKPPSEL